MPDDDLDELLDKIDDDRQRARDLAESRESAMDAFDGATKIIARSRANDEKDGALRAQMAARIRDEESLSLAELAKRVGISRQRAHQLNQAARKAQDGESKP